MGSSFAIGMCVVLYLLQCVLLYNAVCGLLGQVVALHNSGAPTTMMNGPPSSSASGHDANAADAAAKNIINFGEIREGGGPKAYLHNQLHRRSFSSTSPGLVASQKPRISLKSELQRLREQQGELQTFGQPGELPLRAPAPQEFADAEDNLNQSLHDLAIPTAEEAEHWPVVSAPERDREGLAGVLVADRIGSLRDVLRQQNAAMKLGGQARDRSVDLDDLRKDLDDSSIRIADPADVALAEDEQWSYSYGYGIGTARNAS
eukprot:g10816.t1